MPLARFLLSAAVIVAAVFSTRGAVAQPSSASATAERPQLTAAQIREDLATMRTAFLARDRSYSAGARTQAEARLQRLEAEADRPTSAGFDIALAQIAALADNAHTIAAPTGRARRFNRVPVRLHAFGDDFRVVRAASAHAELLGASLVSIDGHALTELRDSARTLVGGTPRRRDRFANVLFESPEQLRAMALSANDARATYVFQTLAGRTVSVELTGETTKAGVSATRPLFPAPLADESGWQTLLAADKAPWALSDPTVPFRWRPEPTVDGLVIELRQTFDAPGQPIRDFLAEMTSTIISRQPRNLVIDMRLNGGGNLNTARDFMKRLPNLVPGRIFVLTSPWTFSAAISSVGYLEQAAPTRVTIVGEEVGDRLEFWAEGRPITLPHSGVVLGFATERHDYKTACRPYTDCHGPVVQNSIAVPTLAPDIDAPWTIEAYRAGRDPAIEAVVAELRRQR